MEFLIYAVDKDDGADLRAATREAHIAYLQEHGDKIVTLGPILNDDGAGPPHGSVIVIDVPDHAAAEEFVANEPYNRAGLFGTCALHAWKKMK